MEDYCDGLQFKNHPLYSSEPQALQIMLYYDEVELCNPLGAAKKIHKVGRCDLNITLVSRESAYGCAKSSCNYALHGRLPGTKNAY